MSTQGRKTGERGTILLVVVFVATAVAALAALSSGRVVSETRNHQAMEQETRAYNAAFAQIHFAMNVVTNSAYDNENHNLAIRDALAGNFGGTAATVSKTLLKTISQGTETARAWGEGGAYEAKGREEWLEDPTGVVHGLVEGTEVRVYAARDYIQRLQKLKGESVVDVDPAGLSGSYFVLEAAGRTGDTIRLVSALVRENEPFSSFVFFQNRHTLGVSGAPRGLIHSNDKVAFYFPDGKYVDPVSAVAGFSFLAGATVGNTQLSDANPAGATIKLDSVDLAALKAKADFYRGDPGLDAELTLQSSGNVRIRPHTPPRYDIVTKTSTTNVLTGYETVTVTEKQNVQVGTKVVTYTETVITGYVTETYWVTEPVYTTKTETYIEKVPVYGTQVVEKTKLVPIYEMREVAKTRQVKVFVPYAGSGTAGGGTAVGGGGGVAGEYVWVTETYYVTEQVQVGTKTETYFVTEQVIVGYKDVQKTRQVTTQTGTQQVQKTRQVPVYGTVTKTRTDPVYELKDVQVTKQNPIYTPVVNTWQEYVYQAPVYFNTVNKKLSPDQGSTLYIDGRITKLAGDLFGRLTIVGNEKVRITGNIRYVDDKGRTAMLNGGDYTKTYDRNGAYKGTSVLGVIARDDVLVTSSVPTQTEINATLMSTTGRVGIDGFWIDTAGNPLKDRTKILTAEQQLREQAYDVVSAYRTRTFVKDSLRRIGGIISDNRILETYITPRSDGTSQVDSGFKRGNMMFDLNLLFNPPPNFVEVPRPVLTYFAPVFFVRGNGK